MTFEQAYVGLLGVKMAQCGKFITLQHFVRDGVAYYQELFLGSWSLLGYDRYHVFLGTLAYDWHRLVDDCRD